jgi:hypothetical protein
MSTLQRLINCTFAVLFKLIYWIWLYRWDSHSGCSLSDVNFWFLKLFSLFALSCRLMSHPIYCQALRECDYWWWPLIWFCRSTDPATWFELRTSCHKLEWILLFNENLTFIILIDPAKCSAARRKLQVCFYLRRHSLRTVSCPLFWRFGTRAQSQISHSTLFFQFVFQLRRCLTISYRIHIS